MMQRAMFRIIDKVAFVSTGGIGLTCVDKKPRHGCEKCCALLRSTLKYDRSLASVTLEDGRDAIHSGKVRRHYDPGHWR